MRLSAIEIAVIKREFSRQDPDAKIYLFGSRVDDSKRGGDIDLLVLSNRLMLKDKLKVRVALYDSLGEQKIDIVIAKTLEDNAFVAHAAKIGVLL